MTTWEHASSRMGNVSDKCRRIAEEVFRAAQAAGHDVWFLWGDGSDPDHVYNRQGRPVIDFMVRNEAAGDWVRNYIWQNRARHGLKHVIWEQHITSTVVQPGVRRRMADRGNPTANHYDHNHAEWFAGTYVPPTPAPTPPTQPSGHAPGTRQLQQQTPMMTGPDVLFIQRFIGTAKCGADDGEFGPKTRSGVLWYQGMRGIQRDGIVGPVTWRNMGVTWRG